MVLLRYFLYLAPMFLVYSLGTILSDLRVYDLWYGVSPIMHSLGGFVTAWTVWMYTKPVALKSTPVPRLLIAAMLIGTVLVVGISWEWYELILDLVHDQQNILGVSDTLIDLTMDAFGASVYSFTLLVLDKNSCTP